MSLSSHVDQNQLFLRQIMDLAKSQEQKLNQMLAIQRKQQEQIDQLLHFQQIQKQQVDTITQIKDVVLDLCKRIPTRDVSSKVCDEDNSLLLRESTEGKEMKSLAVLLPGKDDDTFHYESITGSLPKPSVTTMALPYSHIQPSIFQVHESKYLSNTQPGLLRPKQIVTQKFHQRQNGLQNVSSSTFECQGSSQQRDSNLAPSEQPVFQSKRENVFEVSDGTDAAKSMDTLNKHKFKKIKE